MSAATRYRQNPAVSETEVDDEIFLVEPRSQEVFYLDPIGAALWRLIAEPQTVEEAAAIYSAAFPETDRSTIERDIRRALQELLDRDLAVAAS